MPENEEKKVSRKPAIPDQLIQIAHEQEGGAERVLGQIEIIQNSFEEIQNLAKACQEILARLLPPGEAHDELTARMEEMNFHAENGAYNIQGVFDLFQYQDIVRQKLEKVGKRLIEVSEYVLENLSPQDEETRHAPSGRDILEREAQAADVARPTADSVIAEFFAKARQAKDAK